MRNIAIEANVPFDPQSIIYVPGGSGWIGYKTAPDLPDLPDPAQNNLERGFEDKLGHPVDFATGKTQAMLLKWVEATPRQREELREDGYPP
jgi:hypothetical protein